VSIEENKALVHHFLSEGVNAHDLGAIGSLLAPEFVAHVAGVPRPLDRESYMGFLAAAIAAFPDLEEQVEEMVADGDKVAVRGTSRGTHRNEFQGMAPTGNRIEVGWTDIFRVSMGKIVGNHARLDYYSLQTQLAAKSAPTAAPSTT